MFIPSVHLTLSRRVLTHVLSIGVSTAKSAQNTVVVVGSGAIGMFYGSKLMYNSKGERNRNVDVHFMMRGDLNRAITAGVDICSFDGTKTRLRSENFPSRIFQADHSTIPIPADNQGVSWILCCLKSHVLKSTVPGDAYNSTIKNMIAPLVGSKTKILVLFRYLPISKAIPITLYLFIR